MPITPTYPGVYIEELPSGVRTITGVATSITAFIGQALRGPCNDPTRIQSYAEFERTFGGLSADSTMSYAVQQYFLNGGTDAIIVRVTHMDTTTTPPINSAKKATMTVNGLSLEAANEGAWGNKLRVRFDSHTRPIKTSELTGTLLNLTIKDTGTGAIESFRNVSTDPADSRYVKHVLELESALVRIAGTLPTSPTTVTFHTDPAIGIDPFGNDPTSSFSTASNNDGADGDAVQDADVTGAESSKTGIYALEKADLFNLLCIPPLTRDVDVNSATLSSAETYCLKRRAMLIVDPPSNWNATSTVETSTDIDNLRHTNAAIYFPRIKVPDPLKEYRVEEFVPCGVVAGIMARTDAQRGVWKAPAGLDAKLTGVQELSVKLTDGENGRLNPLGVNCLRSFPVYGNIVWGARTLEGADRLASEWKYIPVRRTALYIEESLYRGTQWVVFEPNDEPLWAQIRLNVGAFMHDLFAKGAFQGTSPKDAYFVRCDKETTTQNDVDKGIVNILVGFAPLKPAEFVMIKIQQIAGNIQT